MNSYSGRLADVGDVGGRVYPSKELMLLKDCVSIIRSWMRLSLVGKSAQTSAECNKLIMVSRVPGYGHLEYLVLGISCESHHVTLINLVGLMMILNWD